MEFDEKNRIGHKNIRDLQELFDKSMRILESHIAESITNKEKLDTIKRDLKEANNKFIEAERCLDDLKVDIENTIIK
tara:strand:- start:439 stop:669 length:231 start_codon:yes stop_codon:yes gene_type:complete